MTTPQLRAAIYARVSSQQQADANTIASQVEALRDRVRSDGLKLDSEFCFFDEGHSGATLLRPALERLRDQAAAGVLDRLYVHSPDRLARSYAYQVLLLEEFRRSGVEVVFLNRPIGRSPEEDLLLQVQGMMAEYERAKIAERSRRGKRHAARGGSVNVLSGAPYGYRYVGKLAGGGRGGTRSTTNTPLWFGRSSTGWGWTGTRSGTSVGGCKSERSRVRRGKRSGIGRRCGEFCGTRLTSGRPDSGRRGSGPPDRNSAPSAGVRLTAGGRGRRTKPRPRSGFRSRSRPLWTTRCTRPLPSNWLRIASGGGKAGEGRSTSCKVLWYAEGAGMRSTGSR